MKARWHRRARLELRESVDWYEAKKSGLGESFYSQVEDVVTFISKQPLTHQVVFKDLRKALVSNFPFVIFYRQLLRGIEVISIFHTSRNPSIWKNRA